MTESATIETTASVTQTTTVGDTVVETTAVETTKTERMVPAHEHLLHLLVREFYPDHAPRETDPHKIYFDRARKRLKELGKLKCWICGTDQNIQLHHTMVEESLKNGVDIAKFEELYPEFGITTDEEFLQWVEGDEHNLTALCMFHHVGLGGVHFLPYNFWLIQRVWQKELESPGQIVRANRPVPKTISDGRHEIGETRVVRESDP